MTFRKDFSNLALQERRLRNQRNADVAQLEQIQKDRRDKHAADLKRALALYKSTRKLGVPFEPAFFGFVFQLRNCKIKSIANKPTLSSKVSLPTSAKSNSSPTWPNGRSAQRPKPLRAFRTPAIKQRVFNPHTSSASVA